MSLKKANIAFLIPMLGGGGAERVTIDIASGIRPSVANVHIIANELIGEFLDDAHKSAELHSLNTYSTLKTIIGLRQQFNKLKPTTVFAQGSRMSAAASVALMLPGHKPNLIWCLHNPYATKHNLFPKPLAWLITKIMKILANKPIYIIGVSDGVCKSFLQFFGTAFKNKIKTIHNPIPAYNGKDHDAFARNNKTKEIIAVGRLEHQKNFSYLIETMPLVLAKVSAKLNIYGIGPLETTLQNKINQLELQNHISLKGYEANIKLKMAKADVFVLSSNWEGLPTVLIEAMSTGVPVVSTNCDSGPYEILENGKWGKLIAENNKIAFANAIVDVLKNGGIDPRVRAKDFEPKKVISNYIDLISTVEENK